MPFALSPSPAHPRRPSHRAGTPAGPRRRPWGRPSGRQRCKRLCGRGEAVRVEPKDRPGGEGRRKEARDGMLQVPSLVVRIGTGQASQGLGIGGIARFFLKLASGASAHSHRVLRAVGALLMGGDGEGVRPGGGGAG